MIAGSSCFITNVYHPWPYVGKKPLIITSDPSRTSHLSKIFKQYKIWRENPPQMTINFLNAVTLTLIIYTRLVKNDFPHYSQSPRNFGQGWPEPETKSCFLSCCMWSRVEVPLIKISKHREEINCNYCGLTFQFLSAASMFCADKRIAVPGNESDSIFISQIATRA